MRLRKLRSAAQRLTQQTLGILQLAAQEKQTPEVIAGERLSRVVSESRLVRGDGPACVAHRLEPDTEIEMRLGVARRNAYRLTVALAGFGQLALAFGLVAGGD